MLFLHIAGKISLGAVTSLLGVSVLYKLKKLVVTLTLAREISTAPKYQLLVQNRES